MNTFNELVKFWTGPFCDHFLPGVLIPAVITLVGVLLYWKEFRSYWQSMLLCMAINFPVVTHQGIHGWDTGLHLLSVFLGVILFYRCVNNIDIRPIVAFSCTWVSLVVMDILGAYLVTLLHPREGTPYGAWEPLAWVGGSGWTDGLLTYPIGSAVFAVVVSLAGKWLQRRSGRLAKVM